MIWGGRARATFSAATVTYVLTGRAEPFAVGDDHERGPQAGCVVAAVAGIAQQDLGRSEEPINEGHPVVGGASREHPPARGGWEDRSVCRGRRLEVGHRPRTWRSPSCVAPGCDSAAAGFAPPYSPRRCRPRLRSPPLRSTPARWRRLQSFAFCDASACWTSGPSAASSPERSRTASEEGETGSKSKNSLNANDYW